VTLPPSPARLHAPAYPKRVRPATYSVAVYLVGGIILLQVGMLISVFWLRAMVVSVNVHLPKARVGHFSAMPVPPRLNMPELPRLPGLASTTSGPVLMKVPGLTDTLQQVGTLNDEAQILLHQNDLRHAAQVLNQAEDLDPRNPTTLKNLAETYYLMNDSPRAKVYWQRIADLGPGVGTIFGLAQDHVMLLNTTADAKTLTEPSPFPRNIYIDEVEKTPVETATGQPYFRVRTVLMRKDPTQPFDQKKLQVYVIFYLKTHDDNLQPDLSQRKGAFENTFLFWNKTLREAFGVSYLMPASGEENLNGEYYGFVIGIYYDKTLQDARSEPSDLVRRMPLPEAIE
jgi:tetratricopeptide (TPR) repeat protein